MNLRLTNYLLTGDYSKIYLFLSNNTSSEEEARDTMLKSLNEAKAFGINSEKIKRDILKRIRESSIQEPPNDKEFSQEIARRVYEQKIGGCCSILFIVLFLIILFIFVL